MFFLLPESRHTKNINVFINLDTPWITLFNIFTVASLHRCILIKLLTTWLNSISSSPLFPRGWEMGLQVPTLSCIWSAPLLNPSAGPPWVTLLAPHYQNRLIMSNKNYFYHPVSSKGFWSSVPEKQGKRPNLFCVIPPMVIEYHQFLSSEGGYKISISFHSLPTKANYEGSRDCPVFHYFCWLLLKMWFCLQKSDFLLSFSQHDFILF